MEPKHNALLFNMDGTSYYAYVGVTENNMSSDQLARCFKSGQPRSEDTMFYIKLQYILCVSSRVIGNCLDRLLLSRIKRLFGFTKVHNQHESLSRYTGPYVQ
jgi:hypothetical protein